jgi:hypothetical protein
MAEKFKIAGRHECVIIQTIYIKLFETLDLLTSIFIFFSRLQNGGEIQDGATNIYGRYKFKFRTTDGGTRTEIFFR